MKVDAHNWARWRVPLVEGFVLANLAFLAVDIYLAHSINAFAAPLEWTPFVFSIGGSVALAIAAALSAGSRDKAASVVRYAVAFGALAVGVGGMLLHLDSRFFEERTLRSLVYSAPFVAPLAYAGLGFLLLLDRMVDARGEDWGRWVVLLSLAGFAGNFGLSLADHAQRGFFSGTEWIAVASAAFAVGFLLVVAVGPLNAAMIRWTLGVMGAQGVVGVLGFVLHARANLGGAGDVWSNFIYGAPVFAPLLFANLAALATIGLVDLHVRTAPHAAVAPAP